MHLNRKVFVREILPVTNEVVLAPLSSMYKSDFLISDVNVVDKTLFTSSFDIMCRIRYRKQNTLCRVVFLENNCARVELAEPLESIAPGQTAVFYREGKILGGGFIE
jgi:tRNA-uridine 2-sulfurtransferase